MKKFLLTATAIAALSAMSTSALAVVDLNNPPAGLPTYAKQLVDDNSPMPATVLAGAQQDVTFKTCVTQLAGTGNERYYRIKLNNGKFAAAPDAADFSLGIPGENVSPTYTPTADTVIYTVNVPVVAPVGTAASFFLGTGGVGLTANSTGSPITMTVSVHGNPLDAQNNRAPLCATVTAPIAAFADGLKWSVVKNTTTADVDAVPDPYKQFLDGAGPTPLTTAKLGVITHMTDPLVLDPVTNSPVALTTLLGPNTSLVVKTSANWASLAGAAPNPGSVYLAADNNCALPKIIAGTTQNATEIGIVIGANAVNQAVCYDASGTTPIDVQDFDVKLVADELSPPVIGSLDRPYEDLGNFIRNGTILRHAFVQFGSVGNTTPATQPEHHVTLSNRGSRDSKFKINCLNAAGTTSPAYTLTIGAGKSWTWPVKSGAGLGCTRTDLRGIELIFDVPNGNIIGSVLRRDSLGNIDYDTMIGSQIGSK